MVVIENKSGQLANRIIIFSHFIANAIENNYTLVNPSFDEYSKYFPAVRTNNFFGHPITTLKFIPYGLIRVVGKVGRTIFKESPWHHFIVHYSSNVVFDLSKEFFLEEAKKKTVIVNGWQFRDKSGLDKYADTIKLIFKPDEIVEEGCKRFINKNKQLAKFIVGVHIRRGDYKLWHNGRYYFDNKFYLDKMIEMKNQLQDSVLFVLCSNEFIDTTDFDDVQVVYHKGDLITDLYTLSKCDFIIGPPSTYSMWASFYGAVPLLHIKSKMQKISLDEFKISDLM